MSGKFYQVESEGNAAWRYTHQCFLKHRESAIEHAAEARVLVITGKKP